ncbi:MAG: imidazolonepropionase [Cytophagales bacterium]
MYLYSNIRQLINASKQAFDIKKGRDLATLESIENAFIICDTDGIKSFGQMSELDKNLAFTKEIDCEDSFVIPSFVDSHTHLVFPKTREEEFVDRINGLSYVEIAKRGGGILNTAKHTARISEEELFESTWLRLREIIKMGTGAVEIKSGYGLSLESELKLLRVAKRIQEASPIKVKTTFLGAHAVPKDMEQEAYVKTVIEEMLPAVAEEKLADYCDVFCDRGFFTEKETDAILNAASKYGLKAKIHANELDYSGGIQVGVKNKAVSVDHLECTGDAEIEALRNSNTIATLLPSTAFFLEMEYPPARKMIQENLAISLASDYNPGSSPSGNMNFIWSLACIKMKMLPEEALNAATVNAAYAMEIGESHGGIYINGPANFIITEKFEKLSFMPYNFGRPAIKNVVLNGEIV